MEKALSVFETRKTKVEDLDDIFGKRISNDHVEEYAKFKIPEI